MVIPNMVLKFQNVVTFEYFVTFLACSLHSPATWNLNFRSVLYRETPCYCQELLRNPFKGSKILFKEQNKVPQVDVSPFRTKKEHLKVLY